MNFTESLKKNVQFRIVYHKGKSAASRRLVVCVLANGRPDNRLGITVSKKVGNSVVRSRVRRLIKESYRLHEKELKRGFDIVVIARGAAAGSAYADIERPLLRLLRKHRILED